MRPGVVELKILPEFHTVLDSPGYREATPVDLSNVATTRSVLVAFESSGISRRLRTLIGCRTGRRFELVAKGRHSCGRIAIRVLFNSEVSDANTPYRLMRRSAIADLLGLLPTTPSCRTSCCRVWPAARACVSIRSMWRTQEHQSAPLDSLVSDSSSGTAIVCQVISCVGTKRRRRVAR